MALRVLLADESVTIKKVFQLALQDFAVDVVTVNVGVDVIQVASKIKPDIIFADVLLQKLNGYDLSREIKSHSELSATPVVLIWSGFMELDEARFKSSGANAHLEKPFDTHHLRQLITSLVPKTKEQKLSTFLSFPKMPEFKEEGRAGLVATPAPKSPPTPASPLPPIPSNASLPPPQVLAPPPASTEGWSMDNFENIDYPSFPSSPQIQAPEDGGEDFVAVQLPNEPTRPKSPSIGKAAEREDDNDGEYDVQNEGQWVQKTLTNYKLAPDKQREEPPAVKYQVPHEKIELDDFLPNTWSGQSVQKRKAPALPNKIAATKSVPPPLPLEEKLAPAADDDDADQLFELDLSDAPKRSKQPTDAELSMNDKQIEAIVRAQAKEIIEKVVWQVVPEVATRIIERELERLLRERKDL